MLNKETGEVLSRQESNVSQNDGADNIFADSLYQSGGFMPLSMYHITLNLLTCTLKMWQLKKACFSRLQHKFL